ncbi:MAG TPA: chromosomal replication initiator protein DnaA [Verrucomicrobiota bacterium]|nr:chromosomal replication initiator protein DnaA [Verrucomicrobiota bacterium]HNT14665.1 chromosomal replication initiator protein DnaA [Verrucomicrobiota bacterium]
MNKPQNFNLNGGETQQATADKIWASAQQQLRSMTSPEMFKLWFAPLRARALDGDCLVLEVANDFCGMWLKDNHQKLLQQVLSLASAQEMRVRFETAKEGKSAAASGSLSRNKLSLSPSQTATSVAERNSGNGDSVFNPKNTFETFVVGDSNNFAWAAAKAVAEAPGKAYNPLFLYGGVGLGKTHLLHAIGHQVVKTRKNGRVGYVSCEKFTNEYIDAIQNNSLMKFRRKYRQLDVLLIDDIQFLAGKERIQEEFFHTFNALHEAHKQIVLSCDRPAGEIQGLENRLQSRFEWGLVTDLLPPDVEIRQAILKKKASLMQVELPDEIITFLAQRIRSNIRRLEGALIRVASYGALVGKKLGIDVVEGLLREILNEEGQHAVTIEVIQKKVAEHYDIRLADMTSKRRPENIAFPRQVAMYLSRQLTEQSLSSIGEAFGGRDHGTVLHACRLVEGRMTIDDNVRQVVNYLQKLLVR